MNADSIFLIGASHAVCQDYVIAGDSMSAETLGNRDASLSAYLILSDGCSSSPDTDIGSRLLVKAAEQIMLEARGPQASDLARIHMEAAQRALRWAKQMGLRPQAVDATLLTAHTKGDEMVLGCSGDGVISLESTTGTLDVYLIHYDSGYPVYPSYMLQPDRLHPLEDAGLAVKEVKHFRCDSIEEPLRLIETRKSRAPTEVFAVKAADYRYAALFSDGITSFHSLKQTETSRRMESVLMEEVLKSLLAFKGAYGAFVMRRVKSFMKDCRAKGWRHLDDLAVGALNLGD